MSAHGLRSAPRAVAEACLSPPIALGGDEPPQRATAIGGLLIDIPDVLYDATLWRRWLVRLVNHLGVPTEYPGFFGVWDEHYLRDVCCGRRDFGEAFQSFLLAAGLSWAQVDEIDAASRIQRENLERNVRPLPGVVKTLGRLAASGLPIVGWVDTPLSSDELRERLARLAPDSKFHAVLSSRELECSQPAADCYRSALKALNLPAEEVAYLGHDARHLAAARAAGLPTVAFNFEPQALADVYLTRFEELTATLLNWPAHTSSIRPVGNLPTEAASLLTEGSYR